jgi:UDP-N-acetylenolpyruvoylglucosamine reductase
MHIEASASLKPYNTFGLPGVARRLVKISSEADVRQIVNHPELGLGPHLILGGGSNIVLTRDVPATVLKVEIFGKRLLKEGADAWIIEAGAGENWHEFVQFCIKHNYGGIENLSLIPGNLGATPIQNIGAYGIEIKDTFVSCEAMKIDTQEITTFDKIACNGLTGKNVKKEVFSEAGKRGGRAKPTTEAREKMSEKKMGRKLTEEHKNKISDANRGKDKVKMSEEHKENISKSLIGNSRRKNGKKTWKPDEEYKARMSAILKGRKQKPVTEETRRKMSESAKNRKKRS